MFDKGRPLVDCLNAGFDRVDREIVGLAAAFAQNAQCLTRIEQSIA